MKKLTFILLAICCILLTGCNYEVTVSKKEGEETGSTDGDTTLSKQDKQTSILDFINKDIAQVSSFEMEAFESYSAVTGENYLNDEIIYEELTTITIPAYERALDATERLKAPFQELEPMIEQIKIASNTFYEALLLQKQALEEQDEEIMNQANEKLQEYSELIGTYHENMKALSKEFGIDYEPNGF
ncbi:hypothetical protein [Sutcliffiella horikoshii]|uniref:hypothetical protein n=1 Tax=Sutcliffiella horikoshii TaxID=79883 RepID=UPI0038502E9C